MIPFNEIDNRLEALRKDRSWLSLKSGRKPDSIRVALAPNAPPAKRSSLLQKALSDAIEAEEQRQDQSPDRTPAPDTITLIPTDEQYTRWSEAYKESDSPTLKDWAIYELNRAAAEWAREKATRALYVAEDPAPYGKQAK